MNEPIGDLMIQTLAMPCDTNPNGDMFGGWLVSQMDLAAGVMAKRLSKGRVTTVAIESMTFLKPVHVGDIVSCYVKLDKTGRSSMRFKVEAWVHRVTTAERYRVTQGEFIFVAIDEHGRPRQASVQS